MDARKDEIMTAKGHPLILQLDAAGNPTRWINYEQAAFYVAKDLVAWSIGQEGFRIHGGECRATGSRSFLDLDTIIAIRGELGDKQLFKTPSLTNRALFRRDQHICAYCGQEFSVSDLTRDHIHPRSRGGKDVWMNVVAACGGCNKVKNDRTPEEAGMELLFAPYAPSRSEHLLLSNRNILFDQMTFLKARIPANSRVHIENFKELISQKANS